MLTQEEVLEQFRKRAKRVAGEIYITLSDALDLVAACDANDLAVLGLEGVLYDGQKVSAQSDMILDCSVSGPLGTWSQKRESCNKAALHFLESLTPRDDLLLIPNLLSEEEWVNWKSETKRDN